MKFDLVREKIETNEDYYLELLEGFRPLCDDVKSVSWYENDYFTSLDALALYGIMRSLTPKRYVEIGSGYSTYFAREASPLTEITCIDPEPRCVLPQDKFTKHIPYRVQSVPLSTFEALGSADILFIDSSHEVHKSNDVVHLFTNILPILNPGVIVHFHDVFLPNDYPPKWDDRDYAEQYMLAVLLLFSNKFSVRLSNAVMSPWNGLSGKSLWLIRNLNATL